MDKKITLNNINGLTLKVHLFKISKKFNCFKKLKKAEYHREYGGIFI